jgi:hypothetical protein
MVFKFIQESHAYAWLSFEDIYFVLLLPLLAAFFASSSIFASICLGDLYGRFEVFFFGLNAIIRVMASDIY